MYHLTLSEFCVWMVGDGTFTELAGLVPDVDGVVGLVSEFCVWMVGDGTFNELAGLVPDVDGVDVLPVSASTMKS